MRQCSWPRFRRACDYWDPAAVKLALRLLCARVTPDGPGRDQSRCFPKPNLELLRAILCSFQARPLSKAETLAGRTRRPREPRPALSLSAFSGAGVAIASSDAVHFKAASCERESEGRCPSVLFSVRSCVVCCSLLSPPLKSLRLISLFPRAASVVSRARCAPPCRIVPHGSLRQRLICKRTPSTMNHAPHLPPSQIPPPQCRVHGTFSRASLTVVEVYFGAPCPSGASARTRRTP